jgi:hypothetical protein
MMLQLMPKTLKKKIKILKMKRLFLTLAAILAVCLAMNAKTVTKNYNYTGFTGIRAGSVFEVNVTKSDTYSVKVEINDEYEKYLVVKMDRGNLVLNFDNLPKRLRSKNLNITMKATVCMPTLEMLNISGASRFYTDDEFDLGATKFFSTVSGASKLEKLKVIANEAEIHVSGASKINVKGVFDIVNLYVSGASSATTAFDADCLKIECSGASSSYAAGKYTNVDIECSGASKTKIEGTTSTLNIEGSGVCTISAIDMVSSNVSVELSGASRATVNVLKMMEVECSGASSCEYKAENPIILNTDLNRASSLKHIK